MKIANGKIVVVAVLVGAVIGVGFSSIFQVSETHAQPKLIQTFIQTEDIAVPRGPVMSRFVDKEYNIVCYMSKSGFFSCTKM